MVFTSNSLIKMANISVTGNIREIQLYMSEPQSDTDIDEESVVHRQ